MVFFSGFFSKHAFVTVISIGNVAVRARPKPQLIIGLPVHNSRTPLQPSDDHVMTTEWRLFIIWRLVMDCVSLSQSERRPLDIRRRCTITNTKRSKNPVSIFPAVSALMDVRWEGHTIAQQPTTKNAIKRYKKCKPHHHS